MPSEIKLLIDEDVHLALAEALRRRGHDAIHVREVDRLGLAPYFSKRCRPDADIDLCATNG